MGVEKTCRCLLHHQREIEEGHRRWAMGCRRTSLLGLLFSVVVFLGRSGECFNVDTRTAVVQEGDRGSMFGYTVAQHVDRGESWLLVGAPKAQTSQPKVVQGGAVYRCQVDREECRQIPFDNRGVNIMYNGSHYVNIEEKSHQWFGATLSSSGTNGVIVACAPRYVFFTWNLERREPVGTCYVSTDSSNTFRDYSPCRDAINQTKAVDAPTLVFEGGHCQAGMAAAVNHDGSYLAIGAVGSYYWQGQVFSQDLNREENIYRTPEAPNTFDDTYMGYSVVVGDFDGDGRDDYAVGVPKGEEMKGKVTLFREDLVNLQNITGEQLGEYFGYSLAVGDFNHDGLSDMAIGAPFYTDYTSDAFENGRVYVYQQTGRHAFPEAKRTIIEGQKNRTRFGLSLSCLGDINNDVFDDLVVGAPYDGPDHKGAIYIFHGSPKGILTKVSQIIFAEDVDSSMSTFGYSLSGGYDMDGNIYPDILVGAYKSDKAVFLKSRPIIQIETEITIDPPQLDLKRMDCEKNDGTPVTCFAIKTCLTFSGLKVPASIDLSLAWKLDSLMTHNPRVFYVGGTEWETIKNETETLYKKTQKCTETMAYVKPNIRDKLTPITIDLLYGLIERPVGPDELSPVLDQYIDTLTQGQAQIQKNCGEDKICIPDLNIFARSLTAEHVLGNTTALELAVEVANLGEDSFESSVSTMLPAGISYVNVDRDPLDGVTVKCDSDTAEEAEDGGSYVICDIGNPLPAGDKVRFIIRATASDVDETLKFLEFPFVVNSTNVENDTDTFDNNATVKVPVVAVANIQVTGVSSPEQVLYNSSLEVPSFISDSDVGPELTHIYEVRNIGPSPLKTATVVVYWPTHLEDGRDLLYLAVQPRVVQGAGSCVAEQVNYMNLTIDENVNGNATYLALKDTFRQFRSKREVTDEQIDEEDKVDLVKLVSCASMGGEGCTVISCEVFDLANGDSALIQVTSRVWINTIIQLQRIHKGGTLVESEAVAQVTDIPYDIPAREYSVATFQLQTYVATLYLSPSPKLQLWIIAVACLLGCLLLLLLMLILWKCGFFKRQKPEDMQLLTAERHSGNGHQSHQASEKGRHYDTLPDDEF